MDYRVDIRFADACIFKAARALLILRQLDEVGSVSTCRPDPEAAGDDLEILEVGLASDQPPQVIRRAVIEAAAYPEEFAAVDVVQVSPGATAESPPGTQTGSQTGSQTRSQPTGSNAADIERQRSPARGPVRDSMAGGGGIGGDSIRISLERIDEINNLVGELVTQEARFGRLLEQVLHSDGRAAGRELLHALHQEYTKVRTMGSALRDRAMSLRMVPFASILDRYRRLVRDLAASTGKPMRLAAAGEETLIDKAIIDGTVDAFVHLIRNAADHGLEPVEERRALNKPASGTITISAETDGSEVILSVSDDGRGLNTAAIRNKARQGGLITAEQAETLPDDQVWPLIFRPGFSTAGAVTDLSGRGVGMDVVVDRVRTLGGTVNVTSTPGVGTKIGLQIPLKQAVGEALVVEGQGQRWAVPLRLVRRVYSLADCIQVGIMGSRRMLIEDAVLPVAHMAEMYGRERSELQGTAVHCQEGQAAVVLVVDRLVGTSEVVWKPVPPLLGVVTGVEATTVLGDGNTAPIVNPVPVISRYLGLSQVEGDRLLTA